MDLIREAKENNVIVTRRKMFPRMDTVKWQSRVIIITGNQKPSILRLLSLVTCVEDSSKQTWSIGWKTQKRKTKIIQETI